MNTGDFHYKLPEELIAQKSVEPRDSSRLMVVHRDTKEVEHKQFTDIVDYFKKGDVLVWNNSKVFKARLYGKLHSGTGRNLMLHEEDAEIFLVRPMENAGVWKVLARPSAFVHPGMKIAFGDDFYCDVMIKEKNGTILVQFPYSDEEVRKKANACGHIPIPPYVVDEPQQFESYQTVYATEEGSVAAPTAGFHFTERIIGQLKEKGVEFAEVTLHVGLGTFLPVKTENPHEHEMHGEWVEVTEENVNIINTAKHEGRRIIAVGTTSVRTLEGVAMFGSGTKISLPLLGGVGGGSSQQDVHAANSEPHPARNASASVAGGLASPKRGGTIIPYKGDIDLFILPGFKFQIVDAMITNFHLPRSTLLMLSCAFAGDREFMLSCCELAVEEKYRLFSFGDSMLIV